MKFYSTFNTPYISNALRRIDGALSDTAPMEQTYNINEADIIINSVTGKNDLICIPGKINILWQLCYETAGVPEKGWAETWQDYDLVVSYYKLPLANYLRIPLGYDPTLFYKENVPKIYNAIVTGYIDGPEGEVIIDAYKVFGKIMHVGPDMNLGDGYHNAQNVSDTVMGQLYRQSKYVMGMRYKEGFELPIIEGGACGCIPITFDMECYSHWFEAHALFVDPKLNIINQLESIKTNESPLYIDGNFSCFTWDKVMKVFWDNVESCY